MNVLSQLLLKNYFVINLGVKFEIYYYALCIAGGMIACAILAVPLFKRRGFPGDYILDVMIAVIPFSIVFARLWYVLLDLKEFDSFLEAIDIRNGGMAIHGGILGGAIGILLVSKIRKRSVTKLLDIGACLLPLGQAIGRWGNFFNQEVYGKPTEITTKFISVYIEKTGQYHYALCFYEMALDFILFALLFYFMWNYKGKRDLYPTGAYLLGYGIIRGALEPLRMEEFQMGNFGIPTSVITSILLIICGIAILAFNVVKDVKENNLWWKTFFKKQEAVKSADTSIAVATETDACVGKTNHGENSIADESLSVDETVKNESAESVSDDADTQ